MNKARCKIIDTYNDFLAYWKHSSSKSTDEKVKDWQTSYMNKYPELLRKQVQNYEEMKLNWQDVARKILLSMTQRLPLMQTARNNLLKICRPIYEKANEKLGLDFDMTFVIYVGIGCGAGWATTYHKQPAVLLGLENIAEEEWHRRKKLEGLISHEIGHLAHMKWRNEWKTFEKNSEKPLFRLYIEGFGQRCERAILGKESWHMAPNKEWLSWCKQHKSWLANEFLERIEKQASTKDFFGSWFNIQGKKQTGYFLGHAFICNLEKTCDLRRTALLSADEVKKLALRYLKTIRNQTLRQQSATI